ncbi:MAG: arginine N-succinyltransferase [Candidatus Omnitrophica bacterium]|nr:arginine N-succinyltransferase [Candidatus Omnitrophota bacterium]
MREKSSLTPAFRIRQARPSDFSGVWPLAKRLDSYNLPANRKFLKQLLKISGLAFRGGLPKSKARYLFLLERLPSRKIIGCSLMIAKHGTPDSPHLWMQVQDVRHASRTLKITRRHKTLTLGCTTDGPTEVGGLVLLPEYRGHPQQLGRQLSYVRFLYMALHPERFESKVLVEYLPPLTPEGQSPLWEAMGRHFTGLSYHRADRLSISNKEFILSLFPKSPIYATLFPQAIQNQLGVVHPKARGACALMVRAGFRYLKQIEPFDGGPYYGAARSKISVIRESRRGVLHSAQRRIHGHRWLLGYEPAAGEFHAVAISAAKRRSGWQAAGSEIKHFKQWEGREVIGALLAR